MMWFNKHLSFVLVFLVSACILFAEIYFSKNDRDISLVDPFESSVRLDIGEASHCSAVHIGDGYLLTAGHCIIEAERAKAPLKVRRNAATTPHYEQAVSVEPLWYNKRYDIGLAKYNMAELAGIPTANLSCVTPKIGTEVTIVGEPLDLTDVHTYGHISTKAQRIGSFWALAVFGNISAAPGNSGSPVYDNEGNVVGILTGGSGSVPFLPMSVIIPSEVTCMLLARTE